MSAQPNVALPGSAAGILGAWWGVLGVVLILSSAIYRLAGYAVEALRGPLTPLQWGALLAVLGFMAYFEGYRGFQKAFSPRVAARARYLREHPHWAHVLAAPLFCMGYFHATRRRKIVAYSLTAGIIALVLLVRLLPQPWRGIIDAGVLLGLGWGIITIAIAAVIASRAAQCPWSPEVA